MHNMIQSQINRGLSKAEVVVQVHYHSWPCVVCGVVQLSGPELAIPVAVGRVVVGLPVVKPMITHN